MTNKNFLWLLVEEIGLDTLKAKVKRPLTDLKVGPFYGCYIVRPVERLGVDEEHPRDRYMHMVIEVLGGKSVTQEPVIVRRNGVMSGAAVFRGTRVPPGPIFSMLAEVSAEEIVRHDYPSVSKADIELALQQAAPQGGVIANALHGRGDQCGVFCP